MSLDIWRGKLPLDSERAPEHAGGPDRLHRKRSGLLPRFQTPRFRDSEGSGIKRGPEKGGKLLDLTRFSRDSWGVGDNPMISGEAPTISGDSPMNSPETPCNH